MVDFPSLSVMTVSDFEAQELSSGLFTSRTKKTSLALPGLGKKLESYQRPMAPNARGVY
jgi:hypothetical protein